VTALEVPAGYSLRTPTVDDAAAIVELCNAVTIGEVGIPWTDEEDVRGDLTIPDRDPEDDVLLVADDDNPVGFLQVWDFLAPHTEIEMVSYVVPALWGRGLNAFLLGLGEERARAKAALAPPGTRCVLQVPMFVGNEAAARLFARLGFEPVRVFEMMRMDLGDEPVPLAAPDGVVIRVFERGLDERALHSAFAEAFADHWGHAFPSFEQWSHFDLESTAFDPGLWFLALDGDEVVGGICCRASTPRDEDAAQVQDLAVRRPWRRRGIGLALALTAFAELRRRGIPRVELSVDAESPTGANRLYRRAGMHVAYGWEFWEKTLRE
jgi:mycothiol synthase